MERSGKVWKGLENFGKFGKVWKGLGRFGKVLIRTGYVMIMFRKF